MNLDDLDEEIAAPEAQTILFYDWMNHCGELMSLLKVAINRLKSVDLNAPDCIGEISRAIGTLNDALAVNSSLETAIQNEVEHGHKA